jgi:hypothetical protein
MHNANQINLLFVAFFFAFFCVKLPLFRMFLCHDLHIPRFFRANARTQKPGYVQTQRISGVPPSPDSDDSDEAPVSTSASFSKTTKAAALATLKDNWRMIEGNSGEVDTQSGIPPASRHASDRPAAV